jgi:hypothetical protein
VLQNYAINLLCSEIVSNRSIYLKMIDEELQRCVKVLMLAMYNFVVIKFGAAQQSPTP